MKKIYGITAAVLSLIMIGLLVAVMAANRRSEAQLRELDSFLATYETANAPEHTTWVKVEAPKNEEIVYRTHTVNLDSLDPDWDMHVEETEEIPEVTEETDYVLTEEDWEYDLPEGDVLNPEDGINYFYGQLETYYNMDMSGVVEWMHSLGYDYEYWIREDGVKMFGPYVMCAADYSWMPKGSILETSLGLAMVCDTGEGGPYWTDIAVDW